MYAVPDRHHVLVFHPRHHDAIISGEKRTTVRWNEDIQLGTQRFIFDPPIHPGLLGEVLDIRTYSTRTITPDDVHEPPSTDMADYMQTLRDNYYPQMPQDTVLQVVTFRLLTDPK